MLNQWGVQLYLAIQKEAGHQISRKAETDDPTTNYERRNELVDMALEEIVASLYQRRELNAERLAVLLAVAYLQDSYDELARLCPGLKTPRPMSITQVILKGLEQKKQRA